MNTKSLKITLIATTAILSIPLIAMFFTDQVDWSPFDFGIAAVLLIGTGTIISYALSKIKNTTYRVATVVAAVVLLMLTWAEMAVGLFGTPLAGS